MNQAQKNYIDHRMNKGASFDQACNESFQVVVPPMSFMQTIRITVGNVAYKVFRGGPDSDPWYLFDVTV